MDILNQSVRSRVFNEIMGNENYHRKAEIYHAIEIYKQKQKSYIIGSLRSEYDSDTVKGMRKITSINFIRKIVNELASIYRREVTREWVDASDQEIEQLDNLYKFGMFDRNLKYSNRYYKYLAQCHIQLLPINGVLRPRVLPGHMLDVVPLANDPETGDAYIIPIHHDIGGTGAIWQSFAKTVSNYGGYGDSDQINQKIADDDDDNLSMMRFAVWTKQYNFITNGKGEIINPETDMPFKNDSFTDADIMSPVPGVNTFIDIADQKDGVYWVDRGLNMAEFAIEFGKIMSDTAETNRAQCFAQGIISALEKPSSMTVGPNKYMFLKKSKTDDPAKDPEFRFENPSPDLGASLDFQDRFLNYFLTSMDLDNSTINSKGETVKYSSGIERLLGMIEKFEASQDDLDIYNTVEQKLFKATVNFNNVLQDADSFESGNQHGLMEKLKGGSISEDVRMQVQFAKPESIRTQKDIEDQQIKLRDNGLTTVKRAIMKIHEVSEEGAEEIISEINEETLQSLLGGGSGFETESIN